MWIILYIFIVLISVIYLPEQLNGADIKFMDSFWIPKELVFMLGASSIIGYSMIENRNTDRFNNKWIGIVFTVILVLSLFRFMSPLIFNTVDGRVVWNMFLIRPTINFILGFILIYVLVSSSSIGDWVKIAKVLAYLGFGFACYAILQWCGLDQIFGQAEFNHVNKVFERKTLMVTFLSNSMLTAHFIAMLSVFCLMFKDFRFKVFYVVCGLAILLTQSAIGIAAYFIGLLVYLSMTRKLWYLLVSLASLVIAVLIMTKIDPSFLSGTGRYALWADAITSNKYPFFGNGLGSFAYTFKSGKLDVLHAHNEWIQFYHEGGLFLVVMSFIYLFDLLKRVWVQYINDNSILLVGFTSALFSYLVIMYGGFPLRIASLALILILIISCLETLTRRFV